MYAHPQARARRRAQLLKITIHQLFHYCRMRQCYRVPFRFVIYRSFSFDFDGVSYLPKHSVAVVNPRLGVFLSYLVCEMLYEPLPLVSHSAIGSKH